MIIFTSGFNSSASGQAIGSADPQSTGLGQLSQQEFITENFDSKTFSWDQQEEIIETVVNFHNEHPDAPIVLVGHSFGADSNLEVAEELNNLHINVDKMAIVDSVGVYDAKIPENVLSAINIWSSSGDGIDAERNIEGARLIVLDNTNHTQIDDSSRAWVEIDSFLHEATPNHPSVGGGYES